MASRSSKPAINPLLECVLVPITDPDEQAELDRRRRTGMREVDGVLVPIQSRKASGKNAPRSRGRTTKKHS